MYQNVHVFPYKCEVLIVVFAAFVPWKFVVAVYIINHIEYLPGNRAFSILRAKER